MNKKVFWVEIADIYFEIRFYNEEVRVIFKDYEIDKIETSNIIDVSFEEVKESILNNPEFTDGYNEGSCIYRKIAELLPQYKGLLMHGAAINYDNNGFIFTAPSGTGKTTHISLWMKYLGEKVDIINGDKPIVRVLDDMYVYGTPWGGKENWQKKCKVPLRGICIIRQSKINKIEQVKPKDVVSSIMQQIFLPNDSVAAVYTLDLLDKLMMKVPIYILSCDMSMEAVKCSFEKMTGLRME